MPRLPQTVTALLSHRAQNQPDRIAYRFLDYTSAGDPEVREVSYRELDRRVRDSAAAISAAGRPGDRVLILCSPGLAYIVNFYGCLYAGMIAVPAFAPSSTRKHDRVGTIARDCGATIVVADSTDGDRNGYAGLEPILARASWLAVGDSEEPRPDRDCTPVRVSADSVAFLQYTSGSTTTPKGVMVSHENLLTNARGAQTRFGFEPGTTGVNWVPPCHDMGLIGGVIMPLYCMITAVHMAPTAFVRSPVRWLEAISRYGAVASGAPDFGYQLCVSRVREEAKQGLDLSRWKMALNGSEPVRPEVMEQFADAFASCGFDKASFLPCYGLAENTLVVSGKPAGSGAPVVRHVSQLGIEQDKILPPVGPGDARPLVSCGAVAPGVTVRIVNPHTERAAPPGAVGEIWVHGRSVASGYHGAPQATVETFQRSLGGSRRRYLRTGDLGAVIDGELYVTGRADDLMIFRGRTVYPQDIEATSSGSDPVLALSRCAAFTVEDELVVVQELPRRRTTEQDRARIARLIRRQISEHHGITVRSLVLAPAGAVPVTSSGKVQRKACRGKYLAGDFRDSLPIAPPAESAVVSASEPDHEPGALPAAAGRAVVLTDAGSLVSWLRASIAAALGLPRPESDDRDAGLFELGITSAMTVELRAGLERIVGSQLPARPDQ